MEIGAFSVEEIKDPTNIIEGKRYEFLIDIEVDEEDELYSEAGIEARVIVGQKEEEVRILNYFLLDKGDNEIIEFALEEEEEEMLLHFVQEELKQEDTGV
ncbi:DUF6509 family protein [Lysinibacillus odysseyi]|uniref:Pullulanase n=1 Tax=Lysinibacillus odysseyi 34hs-1 = NBRC 100172 TaxID=1220589 RepID=A0A0A3JJQ5_9BACI|nr:DUF6509 family protein [Lysinibacillus odysseyi]KGR87222.1 hypothetical protein CD32_04120 [Lysinibacillus odysseyi 34hs-1 = NBRC 100172]